MIKAHEKTRRWDERVGAGTGSLGRGEGMRRSLAPSKLYFEPLQRRRSFLIDPVASRANGQSLELQFVENIPTVCASARAPFPSAAGTRRRRRNRTADRCSVPVRPVPGAICRVRRPVSTPGARAHAAPLRSRMPAWYCLLHKRPHIRKDPSFPADSNVQLSGISIIFDG